MTELTPEGRAALVSDVAKVVHRIRYQRICGQKCLSYDIDDRRVAEKFVDELEVFPSAEES